MRIGGRRRRVAAVLAIGICLAALAMAFNVGWIVLSWREGAWFLLGLLLFPLIVAGLVLNTIFLAREIRRNEQHNAFINAVTHELKTPVASIRLYLETLQSRPVDEVRRQEFYRTMLADSDRLLDTVEQILRAGRAGHVHGLTTRRRLDLAALADEAAAHVSARYGLPPGAIARAGLASAPVEGDADELRAAISNLLDNAIKYSGEPAKQAVQLSLSGESAGWWTLRVSDRGRGIPRNELKAIFKRFYRARQRATQPEAVAVAGTGLGLFIVRSVVRRHHGRVHAESEGPGLGSTFVIELPAAPEVA